MYQFHNSGPNVWLSITKSPYFNSDLLMVHQTYKTPVIITAYNFIWTTYIMLPTQLFDLLMLDDFFLLTLHKTKQQWKPWQQSITHTSSLQLCSNIFTMVQPLSFKKLNFIFGEVDQTSILNLMPNLQDPTSNAGGIIIHTDKHSFLYYSDNIHPAHCTFTEFFLWNKTN